MSVSFDTAFTVLQDTAFIPPQGDWVICLTNRSETILPTFTEEEPDTCAKEVEFVTTFEAALYKRTDPSHPTWHGPAMDATKIRYYQIDHKNPGATQYTAVSDPKVAMDPSDPKTLLLMTRTDDGSWVITVMRPQVITSLAGLAQLVSGRVTVEMFLYHTNHRTHFTVKETLETVHALDMAMRAEFGVGPTQRAARMRIEG